MILCDVVVCGNNPMRQLTILEIEAFAQEIEDENPS